MNKLVAFIKSFRWIFRYAFDTWKGIFSVGNKDATTTLTLGRGVAINHQLMRLASTGGSAYYAFHEFTEMQALCFKHNHVPRRVLEIGTGFNLGILSLFLLSGVEKAYGVDIEPMNDRYDDDFYDSLWNYLKATGSLHWYRYYRQVKPIPNVSFPTSIEHTDFKKVVGQIEYMAPVSSEKIPLGDNVVDLIYSAATFEHLPKSRDTIQELKRLLVNGGLAIHEIDVSYHHYHPNPLEMLRYPEEEWLKMTNQYGEGLGVEDIEERKFKGEVFVNRLRTSDFVSYFEENNFEILEVKALEKFDPKHIDRSKIDKKFAEKTLDDLSITQVTIVARCRK